MSPCICRSFWAGEDARSVNGVREATTRNGSAPPGGIRHHSRVARLEGEAVEQEARVGELNIMPALPGMMVPVSEQNVVLPIFVPHAEVTIGGRRVGRRHQHLRHGGPQSQGHSSWKELTD